MHYRTTGKSQSGCCISKSVVMTRDECRILMGVGGAKHQPDRQTGRQPDDGAGPARGSLYIVDGLT